MGSSGEIGIPVRLALDARGRAALIILGWQPPAADDELDGDGPETNLWMLSVHVPAGREADVPALLLGYGFEPYRMWRNEPKPRTDKEAEPPW